MRNPHGGREFISTSNLVLKEEQALGVKELTQALNAPGNVRPIPLHGVTGSGKTEIYCRRSAPRAHRDCFGAGNFVYCGRLM